MPEQEISNQPFETREQAEIIEQRIKVECSQVTTELSHDKFEPQHWYVDVQWPQHLKLVIRSEKSWESRKHLFPLISQSAKKEAL